MPFQFHRLDIPDLVLIEAVKFPDHRGFFMETYKMSDFSTHGIPQTFVQANHSHSLQSVLRGMHYQTHPKAQGKLVMVPHGQVFDVAVDIRVGSPTYGQWTGVELSAENARMLYVPVGFAHGFCVLSAEADVIYLVTEEYAPECDRGIVWNDPVVGIQWPVARPILSDKDAGLPTLREADNNFVI